MGASTVINLPAHASSRKILEVVGKIAGMECGVSSFEENSFSGKRSRVPPYDSSRPIGADNQGTVEFAAPRENFQLISSDYPYELGDGKILFSDMTGERHAWFLNIDADKEDGSRTLRPGSHPLAAAIGARLVDFFGGSVVFNDGKDDAPGNIYRVAKSKAKFPPRKKEDVDSSRFYLFQNLLLGEPVITVAEIEAAKRKAAHSGELKLDPLIARLRSEEGRATLDRESIPAPNAHSRGYRL